MNARISKNKCKKTLKRRIKKTILESYSNSLNILSCEQQNSSPDISENICEESFLPNTQELDTPNLNENFVDSIKYRTEINNASSNNQILIQPDINEPQISISDSCISDGESVSFDWDELHCSWFDELRSFALKHKLTHTAINDLLKIMREKNIKNLPLDARTLLSSNTDKVETISVPPGEYWHYGAKRALKAILQNKILLPKCLYLSIGIDGVPISKSSKSQFWPILGRIKNSKPFIIGIYCGAAKPKCPNLFLKMFVEEMNDLILNGIEIRNCIINVKLLCFICDAPAKSFITCTKSHNAYFGCGKCCIEGDYNHEDHHMSYSDLHCCLRTNELFRQFNQEEHHTGCSPLMELPIDMITSFPIDYMHLICLGVMKKILIYWTKSNKSKRFGLRIGHRVKLQSFNIDKISTRLLRADQTRPFEFHRQIRPLDVLNFWKATEFRNFLLYIGVVVLRGIIDDEIYTNFLTLHCAVTICLSNRHTEMITVAEELFKGFANSYIKLYGESNVSYNVHNIIHIIDDVKRFGNLENFSAFAFESAYGVLTRLLRSGNKPLQQIANRIIEHLSENDDKNEIKPILKKPFKYEENDIRFSTLKTNTFLLNSTNKNKWFLTVCGNIVSMKYAKHENDEIVIVGKKLLTKTDLYLLPIKSSHLDIFSAPITFKKEFEKYTLLDIKCKLFSLKINGSNYAFFPILHTLKI